MPEREKSIERAVEEQAVFAEIEVSYNKIIN